MTSSCVAEALRLTLATAFLGLWPAAAQGQLADVAIVIEHPVSRVRLSSESLQVRLDTERVTVGTQLLEGLLNDRGIAVDGESLELVRELNPDVGSRPAVGASIVIPRIVSPAFARARASGYLAYLTTHASVKLALKGVLDTIRAQVAALRAAPHSTADTATWRQVSIAVDSVIEATQALLEIVGEKSFEVDGEMLAARLAEVRRVRDWTRAGLLPDGTLGGDSLRQLREIAADAVATLRLFAHPMGDPNTIEFPRVPLRVRVSNNSDTSALMIYFETRGLYRSSSPHEFASLARGESIVRQMVPLLNYRVWAGLPMDPTPLTNVRNVELLLAPSDTTQPYDLSLIRRR